MSELSYIENILDNVGLMRGDYAVEKRAMLGALVGGFVVTYLQPASMFQNGVARPWKVLNSGGGKSHVQPTSTPWYIVPITGAFIMGVLI